MITRCECGHDRNLHLDDGRCEYEIWDGGADGWLVGNCACPSFQPRAPAAHTNGQQPVVPANQGELSVEVWPTYLGAGESTDGVLLSEKIGTPDYERGQIRWETNPNGDIVGRAQIWMPKGVYTHLIFCHGPTEAVCGVEQLEHPVIFDRPGVFEVNPITNKQYLPRGS